MSKSLSPYEQFMETAVEIAENAADIALSYFRSALLIEFKADKSPVTVADRKTEEKIRADLQKAFPSHAIVGEEFGNSTHQSDFVWTIDPIDGTRSFVRGIPLFGTLIGLLHKAVPVVGVMVLPALDEVYYAATGCGAYCNGHHMHVSNTQKLNQATVSVGDSSAFREADSDRILRTLIKDCETIRGYTDCFGHSLVIRGAVDAMIDPLVAPWDVVPIACLVKEAGGEVFGFGGTATFSQKPGSFISATSGLAEQLTRLTAPI